MARDGRDENENETSRDAGDDETMFFSESKQEQGSPAPGGKNDADMADELESARMYIDLLQRQLLTAQEAARKAAQAPAMLQSLERERDKYRATVLSLAYQNKILQSDLAQTRKTTSSKEERFYDAKLQIADLREALATKEQEVEELKAARDYMPVSDSDLLAAYQRMREVFENLRSTLTCSLCYDLFKPGDVLTLECGHTMCQGCLSEWNTRHIRLYNLNTTPDCPECRAPGKHFVKVYLLEEVVRTVDRLERLEAEHEALRQAERKLAHEQAQMSQPEQVMDIEDPPAAGSDEDSEIVTLLLERKRNRYASVKPEDNGSSA